MIPQHLHSLFWDVNPDTFNPAAHPDYSIARVLEFGDERAIGWMREAFPEAEIKRVIRTERRLSRKSANFWALVYKISSDEVAALQPTP
ncbi:MAG: hypothetical protein PHX83_06100 [Acidobacteriia bacterium]|nr:hypothetical protein [Terriglobia bacterium]